MFARAALALLAWFAALAPAVAAGDAAELLVLGFSNDGRYFAFAQSGREPETGFPYASVHALDTRNDSWLRDSPISAVLRDPRQAPRDARREVGATAEKRWGKLQFDTPGTSLARRSADAPRDRGEEVDLTLPPFGAVRLQLTPKLLPARGCEGFAGESVGVTLDLVKRDGSRLRRLQDDGHIPTSRGCPIGYALADVLIFERPSRPPVLAVVFAVFRVGRTGIDRKFLATTIDLAGK